ncbi:MAG: hypothetical protein EOP84_21705, partial [Verrucomicrobiaceae bacterium]
METTPIAVALEQVISASSSKQSEADLGSKQDSGSLGHGSKPNLSISLHNEAAEQPDDEESQVRSNPFDVEHSASVDDKMGSESHTPHYNRVSSASPRESSLTQTHTPPHNQHQQHYDRPPPPSGKRVFANNELQSPRSPKGSSFFDPRILGQGEPGNEIYHKNQFSDFWLVVCIVILVCQFALLLAAAYEPMPLPAFALVIVLLVASIFLALAARSLVSKSHLSATRNIALRNGVCTPEDEADEVPDAAVCMLGGASALLGANFALFTAVLAGSTEQFSSGRCCVAALILYVHVCKPLPITPP